jgi:hypothetical protein
MAAGSPSLRWTGTAAGALWVQPLDSLEWRPLVATETFSSFQFWSPDSRFIAFFVAGKLKKVRLRAAYRKPCAMRPSHRAGAPATAKV